MGDCFLELITGSLLFLAGGVPVLGGVGKMPLVVEGVSSSRLAIGDPLTGLFRYSKRSLRLASFLTRSLGVLILARPCTNSS